MGIYERVPLNSAEFSGFLKALEIPLPNTGECLHFCLCYHQALVGVVHMTVAGFMVIVSNSWHGA